MKRIIIIMGLSILFNSIVISQETKSNTRSVFRVNLLNPGIEYEMSLFNKSTLAMNIGVGYGGSYANLTTNASGWLYLISPFLDVQYRNFYNLEKRLTKQKSTKYNSGNFWGVRMLTRGEDFSSNFTRTSNYDFAFGPTWGLQRSFGKINLLFDLGAVYYFDTNGNSGIVPMFEFNLGYNFDFRKKD
jgi:hypothetical protein